VEILSLKSVQKSLLDKVQKRRKKARKQRPPEWDFDCKARSHWRTSISGL